MGEKTDISWAHCTFNPWIGCTRVSPGCDHCYAATLMQDRHHRVKWGAGEARSRTKTWDQPLAWNRKAAASGEPWRVFCASLADVFDNEVDPRWRADLFRLIHETPSLTWMLLTKRIGNAARMIDDARSDAHLLTSGSTPWPWPNVWLGITVVNQEEADRDIPKLLAVPAAVRWLSCEPLLGPIDLRDPPNDIGEPRYSYLDDELDRRIDWVIVGGESGKDPRPMQAQWARELRDQCTAARVPFHFKQWGGIRPKDRGHMLDGVEHREFPPLIIPGVNDCSPDWGGPA